MISRLQIINIVISLTVVYFAFGLILYFFQSRFVYYPDRTDFYSCRNFDDSEKFEANKTRFYYRKNSNKLIVVYHGNAGSACDRYFLKNIFEGANYSYIFVEYSGYANDKRSPSMKLIMRDVKNVNDFIKQKEFKKIVLFGESLGSGPVAYQTNLIAVDGIILVSPFDSVLNVAKKEYPMYPVGFLLKENYDNVKMLEGYTGKMTIIHGSKDSTMPITHSENLFNSVGTKSKKFVIVKSAGHNDIYDFNETIETIKRSLD